MGFYEFLRDGKSQSCALKFLRAFTIDAVKSVEDKWKLIFGNSGSVVFNAHADKTVLLV